MKRVEQFVMQNQFGSIPSGTKVWFDVENGDCWAGDRDGVLRHDGNEFYIETERSGKITINKGYDAYLNTIRPALA
jgi:hypothetical protein